MSELTQLLAGAWRDKHVVAVPEHLAPRDMDAAYGVQETLLDAIGQKAGGWKIGARTPDGAAQGAPLPAAGIHGDGALLRRADFPVLGLELEIAFSLAQGFDHADAGIGEEEVLQSIASMRVAIELVSSRVVGFPQVPQLIQLSDLQNHGALVAGEAIAYDPDAPFLNPNLRFTVGDKVLFEGKGSNPAGDPRRLLPWVVRHCIARGLLLAGGSVLTTGTYVGAHFSPGAGVVVGDIEGFPSLRFTLE
jgi:2-keto-4-pentenoate hydratase